VPTIVNMVAAKNSLSKLVKRAAAGEQILIASRGKPIAMLSPIPNDRQKVPWDVFKGKIEMTDDFDAPLDEFKDKRRSDRI
jgi:prevent-host-death family protein